MNKTTIAVAALSTAVGVAVLEAADAFSAFVRPSPARVQAPEVPAGFVRGDVLRVIGTDDGPVVLVQKRGEARALPIWIGHAEGRAIGWALRGVEVSRPRTHDLLADTVAALGATVHHVRVERLTRRGVYIGAVALDTPRGPVELDARPSDALALALRTSAAVYLAESLDAQLLDLGR
ncbi:MAG: bifunctional nuclease family protein [Myxococcota bacterium]